MNATTPTAPAEQYCCVYTDGSCHGNPGPGGWAWLIELPDGTKQERSGHLPDTTNIKAEMTAVVEALKCTPEGSRVQLYSDNDMVCRGPTEWLPNWKANGWKKSNGKPVKNVDLWKEIDALMMTRKVTLTHVRAHTGILNNERVDELANAAARNEGMPNG